MKETLYNIFSTDGKLSSSRIGHFIGLISVIGLAGYDTFINKRLDFALAGLILSAGTGGYAIHRSSKDDVKVDVNENNNVK